MFPRIDCLKEMRDDHRNMFSHLCEPLNDLQTTVYNFIDFEVDEIEMSIASNV